MEKTGFFNTAQKNFKTIEGQSIEGKGNIDLSKADVDLANVDNTSDIDKPVSTAQQAALDLKTNISDSVNADQIGDGSVSNTEFQYINSLTSNAQDQIDLKKLNAQQKSN
jgi:hypothetical protein